MQGFIETGTTHIRCLSCSRSKSLRNNQCEFARNALQKHVKSQTHLRILKEAQEKERREILDAERREVLTGPSALLADLQFVAQAISSQYT